MHCDVRRLRTNLYKTWHHAGAARQCHAELELGVMPFSIYLPFPQDCHPWSTALQHGLFDGSAMFPRFGLLGGTTPLLDIHRGGIAAVGKLQRLPRGSPRAASRPGVLSGSVSTGGPLGQRLAWGILLGSVSSGGPLWLRSVQGPLGQRLDDLKIHPTRFFPG